MHLLYICLNHLSLVYSIIFLLRSLYIIRDIFILILSLIYATHLSQLPHFYNFNFWMWKFLTNQHSTNVSFNIVSLITVLLNLPLRLVDTFSSQYFSTIFYFIYPAPIRCTILSSISQYPLIIDPRYLKFSLF